MKLAITALFISLCFGDRYIAENCNIFNNTTKDIDTIIVRAKYNELVMLPGRAINPANSTIIHGHPLLEELEKRKLLKVTDFSASIIFTPEGCTRSYNVPLWSGNKEVNNIAIDQKVLLTCVIVKNFKYKNYPEEPPVIVIKVQKTE